MKMMTTSTDEIKEAIIKIMSEAGEAWRLFTTEPNTPIKHPDSTCDWEKLHDCQMSSTFGEPYSSHFYRTYSIEMYGGTMPRHLMISYLLQKYIRSSRVLDLDENLSIHHLKQLMYLKYGNSSPHLFPAKVFSFSRLVDCDNYTFPSEEAIIDRLLVSKTRAKALDTCFHNKKTPKQKIERLQKVASKTHGMSREVLPDLVELTNSKPLYSILQEKLSDAQDTAFILCNLYTQKALQEIEKEEGYLMSEIFDLPDKEKARHPIEKVLHQKKYNRHRNFLIEWDSVFNVRSTENNILNIAALQKRAEKEKNYASTEEVTVPTKKGRIKIINLGIYGTILNALSLDLDLDYPINPRNIADKLKDNLENNLIIANRVYRLLQTDQVKKCPKAVKALIKNFNDSDTLTRKLFS